jgi:hypothetical protein
LEQMMRAHSLRGGAGVLSAVILAIAVALSPGAAAAPAAGKLSPRLAKLASPALRNAPAERQAKALSLADEGPASLLRRGKRVLVYVRFDRGALAARGELEAAGADVVDASGRYQTITAAVDPSQLHAVADAPGVAAVTPVLAPMTAAAKCPSGTVVSAGDTQLNAAAAREANGVNGAGVTVGILSDSFNQASEVATKASDDVKSGDLPGFGNPCGFGSKVTVFKTEEDASEASDEGRGMAQIVHDLAPGAHIDFASAFNGEPAFATSIRELATEGAKVIADDVVYFEEPFFQDGPVAAAVNEVTEEDGVSYFSSAGNDNLIEGEGEGAPDIASWETPAFRDSSSCPPAVEARAGAAGVHCLDFNPGPAVDRTFGIKVEPESELILDLQWDEPWHGVSTDLDAYLLNSSGFLLAESDEPNVEGTQMPVEVLRWSNESASTKTVQLAVNRRLGEASPRVKFALLENSSGVEATEYPHSSGEDVVGPTIFGHTAAAGAISVGAVRFNDGTKPEYFSSQGPVRHDFGPVKGATPAPPQEEILGKPDLAATDCGLTTFFAEFGTFSESEPSGWHFCGTSAAAPHAAAVAALMRQADPAADPTEVREALEASAVPVGSADACAVGAGLVEAVGAIEDLLNPSSFSPPSCEPPQSEVDPSEAQALGNWGSEVPAPSVTPTVPAAPTTITPPAETKRRPVLPRTLILQRPEKVIRTRHHRARAVFRFGSNEEGVSFVCRIDGGFFRPCPARLARLFPLGRHTVKVAARDAEGNGDKTPASYAFTVRRVR